MIEMSEEEIAWAKALVEDPRWTWVPGMAYRYENNLKDGYRHTYGAARIPNTCLPALNDEATQAILLFQILMRPGETTFAGFCWEGDVEVDGVRGGNLVAVLVEAWLGSAAFERAQDSIKEARRMRSLVNGFFDPEADTLVHISLSREESTWRAMAKFEDGGNGLRFIKDFVGGKEPALEWCQSLRDAAGW